MELSIRLKHPDKLPFIGHFTDPIDLSNAMKPVTMQLETENIEDDPEEPNVTRDANFYREKAKRRRIFYSKKSIMKLQDSTPRAEGDPPIGLIFEGYPWMPPTTSLTAEVPAESRWVHSKSSNDDAISNYAVLQVVKRPGNDGKDVTEVNLIPVGGFYNFRKPAINNTMTLELVDDEFEAEVARRKRTHARYQAFVTKPADADEDEDPPSDKKRTVGKVKTSTRKTNTAEDEESDRLGSDGRFELPAVFGLALKARGKLKKGANKKSYLDEDGVALDEEAQADNEFKGDYEKDYSHNDMAYADEGQDFVQAKEEEAYEHDRAKMDFIEEEDVGPDEDEDDYDDDDDDEEDGKAAPKSSGLVDEQLLLQARAATKTLESKEKSEAQKLAAQAALEAKTISGAQKRPRPAEETDNTEGAATEGAAKRTRAEEDAGSNEPLTDKSVREYITAQGGKVSLEKLKNNFRKQVKAMNKLETGSGVAAISEIVKRICKLTQDVIEGKMVSLK